MAAAEQWREAERARSSDHYRVKASQFVSTLARGKDRIKRTVMPILLDPLPQSFEDTGRTKWAVSVFDAQERWDGKASLYDIY